MNKAHLALEGELSLEGRCQFYFRSPDHSGFLSQLVGGHFLPGNDPREAQYGFCRVAFAPLANQGSPLVLEGNLGVAMGDFNFESPVVSDWLEMLFLRHFYPENTPCEGEDIKDDCPIEAGLYRLTIEALS